MLEAAAEAMGTMSRIVENAWSGSLGCLLRFLLKGFWALDCKLDTSELQVSGS